MLSPPARRRALRDLLARAALGAAIVAGAVAAGSAPASAASTCAAHQITVTALQSQVFYIDAAQNYLGSYVGYRVTDTGSAPLSGLWVELESFTGGVVGPASGASTTAPLALDPMAAGASTTAYAYLKAATATTTPQAHDVVIYSGRPGAGGTEVCRETQTMSSVADVIKASANKVTGASVSASAPELGGTFQLTVTGQTGTIGAGTSADPGVVRFSPAVAANWPSTSFRLIGVTHQLPAGAAAAPDLLSESGLGGTADEPYSITYTFRVVGPTTTSTPVVPVQNIASGTQVKHTDPGTLGSLAPIPVVTSDASFALSAPTAGPYASGQSVPLRATITNAGDGTVTLDEVVLTLPGGWAYQAGSAERDGSALPDPYDSGGTELHLVGPFAVGAHSTSTFGIDATAGSAGTSGDVTAVGKLAGGQIDGTTDVSDSSPATLALAVLGAPAAHDDTVSAATGATTSLDVLANDDLASGTATVAVTQQPAHGTATVAGDRIDYTPDAGYSGPDALDYSLSTQGGTSTAHVTITVATAPAAPTAAALTSTGVATTAQHADVTVPSGGTVTLLDGGGLPADTVAVAGGTYTLDPLTGRITFAPAAGFSGPAPAVSYSVADAFGQTATATYTATVTLPAPPAAAPASSTGAGPAVQTQTLPIPTGGSVTLLDGSGNATTLLDVPGEGDYALDTTTGIVSFVPAVGFSGTAAGAGYRVADAYGQTQDSTYVPTVLRPAAPAPSDVATTAAPGVTQQTAVVVPAGGSVTLLVAGVPATTALVPGEGTYTLDPATGEIDFAPEPGFAGSSAGVTFQVTDAYGQSSTATYRPRVVAPLPVPPVTVPGWPSSAPSAPSPTPAPSAPSPASRPAAPPKAAPAPPRAGATASVPRRTVVAAASPGVPVQCRAPAGGVCRVTVTARVGGRTVVVGTATGTVARGRSRRAIHVTLNSLGRALVAQLGGRRLTVRVRVSRPRGRVRVVTTATRVVARTFVLPRPVFFDTSSAVVRRADRTYLRRLRARLARVRSVTCIGYTDSRDSYRYNRRLGQARARAVCAMLLRGLHIAHRVITRGERRPWASNRTAGGMQLNRRTEIRITY